MSTILLNLIKNNKDLILKYGGYLGLILVVLTFFGSYCYNWGQKSIQEQWNQEKEVYEKQIRTLKDEYYLKELTYREENTKIQKELADAKKNMKWLWLLLPLILMNGCASQNPEQNFINVKPNPEPLDAETLQALQVDSTLLLQRASNWLKTSQSLLNSVTDNSKQLDND